MQRSATSDTALDQPLQSDGHVPARAEIDLSRLDHNVERLRRLAGPAKLMAVVKADAYGHGAVAVARRLEKLGIEHFAVATPAEGIELRTAGIGGTILVFGALLPGDLPFYAGYRLDATVATSEAVDAVLASSSHEQKVGVHLKIDTGMGRIGFVPRKAEEIVRRLERTGSVRIEGLWSHLATADSADPTFVEHQLEVLERTVRPLRDAARYLHVANSGALLNHRGLLDLDDRCLVRPGITLYGLSPAADRDLTEEHDLLPIMRFVSRVTQVKTVTAGTTVSYSRRWEAPAERVIATVSAGYADGYPREMTNRGRIGIQGRLFPVAGTVCMDMTMVDLGDPASAPDVRPGEDAVIFGTGGPSCFDVASVCETITYEIVCRVGQRVRREYLDERNRR